MERRRFAGQLETPAALASALALILSGCAATEPAPPPLGEEVTVTGGTLRGRMSDAGVRVWEGIPFAAPPTGELRWAPPAPVEPWSGVRDATVSGPICAQLPGPEGGFYSQPLPETSEDCLTLNVWSAAETAAERRPVMYWIHGGGLTSGSGSQYQGISLASQGVVLVTVNYRLGPLGFFAHPELSAQSGRGVSGNQGLRDQIAGLEWVRDNVSAFGGDPGNVTIFGESAGSLSVSLLQASPLARGLFHRAIGQSGGSFQPMARLTAATPYSRSAEEVGESYGEVLAGEEGDSSLAALRQRSSQQVLEAFAAFNNYETLAVVDGEVIPREVAAIFAAGEQSDVPALIGSNADEGSTFLPYFEPAFGSGREGYRNYVEATLPEVVGEVAAVYPASDDDQARQAWADLFADVLFTYPQRAWARGMASVSSPAYLYFFTWEPPVEDRRYGAFHAAELGYLFGDLELFGSQPTEADRAFAETLSDLWVRFAATGDPNGSDLPSWPPYTADNEAYLRLGEKIEALSHLRMEQIELIDRAFAIRRGGEASQPTGR